MNVFRDKDDRRVFLRMLRAPRRNIALRPEQIRTLAEALSTTADYLIRISETWRGVKGPSGKVRHVFEQVSKLPRRKRQKVVEFVEAFVRHKAAAG